MRLPVARPPQPDWLRRIASGLEGWTKLRLLIDGVNFAVVQSPGRMWSDNSGQHYGETSYYLVDKRGEERGGAGFLRCSKKLKCGGRIGAKIKREWKVLVNKSDKANALIADGEDERYALENLVDNIAVYLTAQRNEAEKMRKGKLDDHGCGPDYWSGHVNAFNCTLRKLKELVPGILPEDQ